MTDLTIPYAGEAQDRAILLLDAAESLGHEPEVVRTVTGAFVAPEDVVDKAGLGKHAVERQGDGEVRTANDSPVKKAAAPAKKAAAPKAPAKKAAARKTTAKKAAKKAPANKSAGE